MAFPEPRGATPGGAGLAVGQRNGLYVDLVARHTGWPHVLVERLFSADALAAEVGRLLYAYARREAERVWEAREDPPTGTDSVSRLIRARHAQLAAAAKAEEHRRLRELLAEQRQPAS